jgi:hypothetical protein
MAFDIAGARAAGYSDDEIADYLSADKSIKFDVTGARDAGYSSAEILDFVGEGGAEDKTGLNASLASEQFKSGLAGMQSGFFANNAKNSGALLASMDRIDRGEKLPMDQDPLGYQDMDADQRKQTRANFDQNITGNVAKAVKYNAEQKTYARNQTADQVIDMANKGDYSGAWAAFKSDPTGVMQQLSVESAPNVIPSLAGGVAGVLLKGGIAGLMAGLATGSYPVEYISSITDSLQSSGVDLNDSKAVEAKLRDPAFIEAAGKRAGTRGLVIAAADAASGRLMAPLKAGQLGRNVARGVGNVGTEVGLEMGGEAGAQTASGEEIRMGEVIAEGLGAGPQTIGVTAIKTVSESRTLQDIGKATSVDEAIATASEVLNTPPLQLENKPDPLISFPDGTVGRQSEVEEFIKSLPENEQSQARATLLGMGPQDIKPGDIRETLRERDFVPEPSGSFGMINEFADLMNQEKSDLERRRSGTDTELESLVSTERADVEQRRAGLIDSAIGNQIADVDAQVAANREQQAQQNRLAVMDQVIGSEAAIGMNPAQLSQAFTQALTEQGYANATPTAQESARIERAAMARDAMLESEQSVIEPSAPNEMDVAALIPEKKPKPVSADPLSRVKNLTAQGYTLQGKQLQGPTGDKINLSRAELLYVKAQRKGASNDGNTTATNLSGRDVGATGAQTADPVLGDAAPGTETVPQPDQVRQADPTPAAVPGRADDPAATIPADQQPALTEDADTGDDIPVSYFKKVKVDHDVYIEDEQRSETTKVPAKEALASVREDIDNYRTLLNCLRG